MACRGHHRDIEACAEHRGAIVEGHGDLAHLGPVRAPGLAWIAAQANRTPGVDLGDRRTAVKLELELRDWQTALGLLGPRELRARLHTRGEDNVLTRVVEPRNSLEGAAFQGRVRHVAESDHVVGIAGIALAIHRSLVGQDAGTGSDVGSRERPAADAARRETACVRHPELVGPAVGEVAVAQLLGPNRRGCDHRGGREGNAGGVGHGAESQAGREHGAEEDRPVQSHEGSLSR